MTLAAKSLVEINFRTTTDKHPVLLGSGLKDFEWRQIVDVLRAIKTVSFGLTRKCLVFPYRWHCTDLQ